MFTHVRFVSIAAVLLALGVILGAFGAHALKHKLDAYGISVYEKAVFYHLAHALGMLVVCVAGQTALISETAAARICVVLLFGILLFSGSLYILALSGLKWLGAITPLGGTAFILAWLLLAFEAFRNTPPP
jgi:uncharacterized membrane protein YgdD (TMEM256/DUF423 family)